MRRTHIHAEYTTNSNNNGGAKRRHAPPKAGLVVAAVCNGFGVSVGPSPVPGGAIAQVFP